MRKLITFCAAAVLIPAAGIAHADMLLVQTYFPSSGANNPSTIMDDLGITYNQILHNAFKDENLSYYNSILLQGSYWDLSNIYYKDFDKHIMPNMDIVHNYVESGGLVLMHYADWFILNPADPSNTTDPNPNIGPLGVSRTLGTDNTGNIAAGFEADPLFNKLTKVTDASLDDWNNTSHGYLTGLPANADVLITNGSDLPVYARYTVGLGQVWITTMALEWSGADPDVLINEIALANQFVPVPVPAGILLGMLGLGVAGMKLRKFV